MIYSVFDWNAAKFRVYQDSRQFPLMSDPQSCAPAYRNKIGIDVNAALCPIPADAKFMGWSDVAQGQVSRAGAGVPSQYAGQPISNSPDLGGLGFLGQTSRPVSFGEAIFASALINIAAGIVSAWFFKHVRVPIKTVKK